MEYVLGESIRALFWLSLINVQIYGFGVLGVTYSPWGQSLWIQTRQISMDFLSLEYKSFWRNLRHGSRVWDFRLPKEPQIEKNRSLSNILGSYLDSSLNSYLHMSYILLCKTLFPDVKKLFTRVKKRTFYAERQVIITIIIEIKTLNLWLTARKGATPVNLTSATDWQMAAWRDNVISILLRQVNNVDFLKQIRYFSIK